MKLPHRRHLLHLAAGAAALPAMSRIAWAQAYPTRPIRLVIPFPPRCPHQSKQPTNAEVKFSRKRISVCGAALPHLITRCIDR
jgi:hypothetical protein